MKNQTLSLAILIGSILTHSIFEVLMAQEGIQPDITLKKQLFFSPSLHDVATIGASTSGSLVDGCVGSIHKGCRHRFFCHSSGLSAGFIGLQETSQPLILNDQPGVFPAPPVAEASITFEFHCKDLNNSIIPVIARPDGTVYQGLTTNKSNSPQTLVVSSPAQTGIYTLFVLSQGEVSLKPQVSVEASISTQPQNTSTFYLKPFDKDDLDTELISAEFVYSPSS